MVATRAGSPTAFSSSVSRFSSRPAPTIAMPIPASFFAHPKPMPLLAPVTTATCISPIHLCQHRSDPMLEYLACVVLGQRIPNGHLFWRLEFRDALALQQREQAGDVRRRPTLGHNDRTRPLPGAQKSRGIKGFGVVRGMAVAH